MFINFCCSHSGRLLLKSSLIRSFQTSSRTLKNHYEILGLKHDCTQKEIRTAFVTLSKEHHPDAAAAFNKSGDVKSNDDFIKVMEAYQVLSKTHSRANYDLSLRGIDTVNYVRNDIIYEPWKVDPSSYTERGPNYSPYYGVPGIKKMANWKIVLACLIFCATGILLQTIAISRSITFKREQLDKSSAAYQENHDKVRTLAVNLTNTEQIELIKSRLKSSPYE